MSSNSRASGSKQLAIQKVTEFDVLKASHKFLRDDDGETNLSWEDEVARKYYTSLYREFAVCDLKHFKSGNFALRWRTEEEVLSGAGEETCGNTRCTFHEKPRALTMPPLNTLELSFAYEEHGERKSALVKVVLCGKCLKKLMWKREKEKEEMRRLEEGGSSQQGDGGRARLSVEDTEEGRSTYKRSRNEDEGDHNREHERSNCPDGHKRKSEGHRRRRSSRSRSPKHRHSKRYERESERRARSPRND